HAITDSKAQDREPAHEPQAQSDPARAALANALANGNSASLAAQRIARTLRVLRAPEQLSGDERLLARDHARLVRRSSPKEPAKPRLAALSPEPRSASTARSHHHPTSCQLDAVPRVTLVKSRVRERRTLGSVRAKA